MVIDEEAEVVAIRGVGVILLVKVTTVVVVRVVMMVLNKGTESG